MTTILTILLSSLIVALLLTPLAGLLGRWGKAIDKPDGIRKNQVLACTLLEGVQENG